MKLVILMVVDNNCVNDSRVIKEAAALAAAGHSVTVLCRQLSAAPSTEERGGVTYAHAIPPPRGDILYAYLRSRFSRHSTGTPAPVNKSVASPDARAGAAAVAVHENSAGNSEYTCDVFRENQAQDESFLYGVYILVFRILKVIYGKSRSLFIRYAKKTLAYVSRPLRSWARPLSLSGPVRRAALRIKPDVIHVHDLVPLYAAVSTASETDSKVIYDAHELELHRVGRKGIHRLLAGMHERYAIRYVERVITVCDSIADYLRDHYRIKRPLVILNSPNIDADCDNKGDIRSAAGVEPGIPLVVYVGKITIHRGLEEVLRAVSLWTDGHFAMVGPVHEETRRQLKALTVDLGIEDRVRFIDSVSPDCVVDFISSADIGIIATQDASLSYRFSLPNKLFEMTLAGLVLCASDLPEHRRYLSEFGNGILMDQAEPEKIASAIKYAWKNIDELKPDAEKLAEIRENYGWGRQAAKLADLYSTLGNV